MKTYKRYEKKDIKRLLRKTKDTVLYRKYQTIFLHMDGLSNTRIAEIVLVDRKTVGVYINQYIEGGIDALVPKKPPGRPRLLTEEQELQVYATISNNTPEDVGFDGIKNWTAKIACLWVTQKFGVKYSVNGMLDLFHRLNLSYTRPTYVLAKADPEAQKRFKEHFEDVKKNC